MTNMASIVIRCYNEERHIGRLLSGILQQTVERPEIIVVDSGSTDATLAIASRYPTKVIHIKPEEFSFGRSLNDGCRVAKGEFIAIASAHVYPVHKDWLERLLAPFADPSVGLVYGKQRGNEATKYSEHQVFARWFPDESNLSQNHPFCNNANAAVRRSTWEKLPYDETLTGLEDLDWARRAMGLGHRIVYAADADVVHVHDEFYKQIYNRYRREAIALKHVFPHERFSLWNFARLLFTNTMSDCRHAHHDRVLGQNLGSIFLFRLMQFWGTYRGYRQPGSVTDRLRRTFYYPNTLRPSTPGVQEMEDERLIQYGEHGSKEHSDGDH